MRKEKSTLKVSILSECQVFSSSIDFRRSTERLLLGVPAKYLTGLDKVILRDSNSFTRKERKRSERDPAKVLTGAYHRASGTTPARIHLFIDNIASKPSLWLWIPPIRELLLAGPLYHELGHHIQEQIIPEYKDREATAEAWSRRLTREYFDSRYRYLLPLLKILRDVLKSIRGRKRLR